ncbi:hypothetical protein EV384_0051 [Micromonospora kangleipakensis]|uniref:Uncharacterized protein n=1 Tax=Micromonospora kangleipakensis TaxID=1077942 RepID=A0A4Q8B2N7_9ACTN|nr:hypothetical protein [Micromonospora kangleipakensis]RZU71722.1 hypothetical protein EV384_0051 [Micromonospora kangleipakensis]
MSGRRSGRLLGVTLALVALAALAGGVIGEPDLHQMEYDWSAAIVATLVP